MRERTISTPPVQHLLTSWRRALGQYRDQLKNEVHGHHLLADKAHHPNLKRAQVRGGSGCTKR